jgi:hypothetical protein
MGKHRHHGTRGSKRHHGSGTDTPFNLQQTHNTTRFCDCLGKARALNPHGCCVSPQNPHYMEGSKMFLTPDGLTGCAVKPDGDIVGVFNSNTSHHGAAKVLLQLAVEHGGDRLDCYGTGLVRIYSANGFEPVNCVPYDGDYVEKNDFNRFLIEEEPSVYTMMYTGVQHVYQTERQLADMLDKLPKMDYDSAMAERDALIEHKKSHNDSNALN